MGKSQRICYHLALNNADPYDALLNEAFKSQPYSFSKKFLRNCTRLIIGDASTVSDAAKAMFDFAGVDFDDVQPLHPQHRARAPKHYPESVAAGSGQRTTVTPPRHKKRKSALVQTAKRRQAKADAARRAALDSVLHPDKVAKPAKEAKRRRMRQGDLLAPPAAVATRQPKTAANELDHIFAGGMFSD